MTETEIETDQRTRMHALPPPTGATGALYLNRTARRVFDQDCEFLRAPRNQANVSVYLTDMLRPYRLRVDADLLAAGAGQSYGEMALALIEETVDEPVDLLVLAFAMPDVWPGRATATYLSDVCPGQPLSFAICDQGSAAAFTGLRLVREYVVSGACRRALLLVLEQATLHYPSSGSAPVPDRHAGVALLCTGEPGDAVPRRLDPVHISTEVMPAQAPGLLASRVAEQRGPLTVIAGAGLDPATLPVPVPVRGTPAGQPYTGVWWELSGMTDVDGAIMLADYDPAVRYLATAYCGVE
jgi:hypothetical protein